MLTTPPDARSYTGLDSNLSHTYSYNMTLWNFFDNIPTETESGSSAFNDSSLPHMVEFLGTDLEALNLTFVDTAGLVEADSWTILLSSCGANSSLPEGASATLTSQDGTAEVRQLTLDRGYEGTVPGSHDVFSVNQHFTVRAAGEEMALTPKKGLVVVLLSTMGGLYRNVIS